MRIRIKVLRSLVAWLAIALLLSQSIVSFADNTKDSKAKKLTEEQRIVHVLNRLGFGARPGDVERVKAMGVEKYIEQQLHPEKITGTVAENKVRDLSVINMATAELYEKYPQPGQLLRQLQARGKLPEEMSPEAPKNNQNQNPP